MFSISNVHHPPHRRGQTYPRKQFEKILAIEDEHDRKVSFNRIVVRLLELALDIYSVLDSYERRKLLYVESGQVKKEFKSVIDSRSEDQRLTEVIGVRVTKHVKEQLDKMGDNKSLIIRSLITRKTSTS